MSSVTVIKQTPLATLGTSHLDVKGNPVEVLVVTTPDAQERFYLSPLIAKTAFEDINKEEKSLPSFEGRSKTEMIEHLIKNAK